MRPLHHRASGGHNPAKQSQSSPALVNFHFDFGGLAPVNSKKCDAGIRQRPFGNRRPSERKLITDAPLASPAESPNAVEPAPPHVPPPKNGCRLCRPDVIAEFKIWGGVGKTTGARIWLNAA